MIHLSYWALTLMHIKKPYFSPFSGKSPDTYHSNLRSPFSDNRPFLFQKS